ncbi:hypothetical protein PQX77_015509 [Marasmius sp. AFHP31]|nr:hypothetical protein PQX77_015509 [Marasmius sp. AFHP31]
MSILRRVPVEVWRMVFFAVCGAVSYSFRYDARFRGRRLFEAPPLILSQVSPLWRAITRDFPQLWSSISIEFVRIGRSVEPLINLYLANSGRYPLMLRITRELNHGLPLSEEGAAAWKALSPHLNRCEELSIAVSGDFDFPPIYDLSFPNLLALYEEIEGDDYPPWFWKAVGAAPRLTRVKLDSFDPPRSLPYHQLTSLEVQYCGDEDAKSILRVLPTCRRLLNLEVGRLAGRGVENFDAPSSVIEIPALRKLSICATLPDNPILDAYCRLSLPALTDIEVTCHNWPTALHALLERSSTSLEKVKLNLSVSDSMEIPDHFFSLIPSFHRLTHLELCLCPFEFPATVLAEMLSKLQPKRDSDRPLVLPIPRLTYLLLEASPDILTPSVGDGLLTLVRSRKLASHPLKIITISLVILSASYSIAPAIAQRVQALEDAGINVNIEGPYVRW